MSDTPNDPIQSIKNSVETIERYYDDLKEVINTLKQETESLQSQTVQLNQATCATLRQVTEQSRLAQTAFESLQELIHRHEQEYEQALRRMLDAFEAALQEESGKLKRVGARLSQMSEEHVQKAEAAADAANQAFAHILQSITDSYSTSLHRARSSFELTLMRMNEELEARHRQLLEQTEQRLDALLNEASSQLQSGTMTEALEAGLTKGLERLRQEIIEEVRRPWWKKLWKW